LRKYNRKNLLLRTDGLKFIFYNETFTLSELLPNSFPSPLRNSTTLLLTQNVRGEPVVTMYGIVARGRLGLERIEGCGTIRVLHFLHRTT